MAVEITEAEYDALWQQANPVLQQSESVGCVEVRQSVPQQLGQGYIQHLLWHDIDLMLFNVQFYEDIYKTGRNLEETEIVCEFGFNLSGNLCGKRTGESFVEWGLEDNDDEQTSITYANDPILKVDIHLEIGDRAQAIMTETLAALPASTRRRIENRREEFCKSNAITPAMRLALEQILHCPFEGMTKQLYLESKCIELIALKIEQIKETGQACRNDYPLNADDIERIYAAKDILIACSEAPPSLMALARQVNLNDYKLKVGFKAVFGTTVFGCLHQHRMETARQLLSQGHLNVKEVAQQVGYASQSRFAAAFRKRFGLNPKAYLVGQRSRSR